ncbi:MAG: hypothetical protein AAGC57_12125 [Pseudomonadota bacterium]
MAAEHCDKSDRLALTLRAEADGSFYVRDVEILNEGSRLRVSFQRENRLEEVLSAESCETIADVARKASEHRGMLALPDLRVSLRNLVLAGCRVLISAAEDGAEHILIRFGHCFGNLLGLFRKNVLALNMAVDELCDSSARRLDELYLQIANFSSHIETVLGDERPNCPIRTHRELAALSQRIRTTMYTLNQRQMIERRHPSDAAQIDAIRSLRALPSG